MLIIFGKNSVLTPDEEQTALNLVRTALAEDLAGQSDVTTTVFIPADAHGIIRIVSRQAGVLCGGVCLPLVLQQFPQHVTCSDLLPDGSRLSPGTVIAELQGSMRTLLTAERTILNFLTLLSGTSSLTHQYVEAVAGTGASILDTRKTLPGLRALQKYAVRCGGGVNHRIGLYDAVLVKDNHLAWYRDQQQGSLAEAVQHVRESAPSKMVIEFEVDSLDQLRALLPGNPDIVLLDNMSNADLKEAVQLRNNQYPGVLLEASGGVNLQTVRGIAETGVDRISVGALTHSAPALDIGFDWGETA
ncbi:carboxylating nicotinate-nucleotide diphosphorylase [Planctomicrobium sp. SH661]|uniref:carboxylating nicotinate-nucleotide diphosphorylase n=1 Tax=Planctomicrobium sp. SH661 TaxID=3448124 RepID=UPI003F5C252F